MYISQAFYARATPYSPMSATECRRGLRWGRRRLTILFVDTLQVSSRTPSKYLKRIALQRPRGVVVLEAAPRSSKASGVQLARLAESMNVLNSRVPPESIESGLVEGEFIFVEVRNEPVSAEDPRDLHELVVVVLAVEEGVFDEEHTRQLAAEAPYIEGEAVATHVDEQFRTLKRDATRTLYSFPGW